jgi:hypothetical protein
MSDLHLEKRRVSDLRDAHDEDKYIFDFPANADILALLGDIGNTRNDSLYGWLSVQLARFKLILFVIGNHEPYGSTLVQSAHGFQLPN